MTAGNVGLFNAKLAGFDMGSQMAALPALSGIKGAGHFHSEANIRIASSSGRRSDYQPLPGPTRDRSAQRGDHQLS